MKQIIYLTNLLLLYQTTTRQRWSIKEEALYKYYEFISQHDIE